jgi:hypothetical protein
MEGGQSQLQIKGQGGGGGGFQGHGLNGWEVQEAPGSPLVLRGTQGV